MKILLVDDNELILHRLTTAIQNLDSEIMVKKAFTCDQALNLSETFKPDFILLDISLPDGSGIDILRSIKTKTPLVNVCMFTNYATEDFQKRCAELGADCFFEKTELNALIDSIHLRLNKIQIKKSIT